jgi:hypothetical protein
MRIQPSDAHPIVNCVLVGVGFRTPTSSYAMRLECQPQGKLNLTRIGTRGNA